MALHKALINFTGGEITSQLDARVDLQKYGNSCRRLENFKIRPYGGATFRAGTLYIAPTAYADQRSRLIPFVYSTSVAYILELGHQYIRFFRDGAQIESSPGTPYEIASDFAASELFAVQFKQINDVMYLVHPDHPPRKIQRLADANWTTANANFDYPPLLDENVSATTLTAGATTGLGISLTASTSTFVAGHVGAYFELRHLRAAQKIDLDLSTATPGDTFTSGIKVKGNWRFKTTERWYGEVRIQRSPDNTNWTTYQKFTSASDANAASSGFQEEEAYFRIYYVCAGDPYGTPPWVGTVPTTYVMARAAIEVDEAYVSGLVVVVGVTNGTTATANVIVPLENTTATAIWSEGAWSTARGYPRAIGLFEQRLFFGGTAYKPTTIWGSVTGDFENFAYGETDDAAVAYQMAAAQQNPVNWLESLELFYAGTAAGEHTLSSGNENEALTPSNVTVRDPSAYGSEPVQCLKVKKSILFVQRQGKRLRELKEDQDPEQSTDLTVLAEHLMQEGFRQIAYACLPDPYLYAVMANGHLAVMAFMPEQGINGWSRYITDGEFESVAAVPGASSDVVYVVVKRTINGATVRYVEVFTAESIVGFQWMHMDCAKTYVGPLTTVTGLAHLEGEQVAVVAGGTGYVIGDVETGVGVLTVSGGQITLPRSETFIRVGLLYRGKIEPMTLDAVLSNGTSQGRKKRISELVFRFKDTLGGRYGNGYARNLSIGTQMAEIPFRSTEGNMDESPGLQSQDIPVQWEGGNEFDDDLQVSQTQPLPMTLLGIFAKMEAFGS